VRAASWLLSTLRIRRDGAICPTEARDRLAIHDIFLVHEHPNLEDQGQHLAEVES